jgi:DNA-binding NtrC family response regulator
MMAKPRVLVVDDENAVRASFDRVLSDCGFSVNAASDGPSALEYLRREPVDLAFVDLRMPGMNGMDVVRNIRRTRPEIQVVIVTGYGTEETAQEARALGVGEFVAKPLGPAEISGLAERALARKKQAQASAPPAPAPAAPAAEPRPAAAAGTAAEAEVSPLKMMGLLLRGSLLGLAYVVFLPVIGFAMLGWLLVQKAMAGIRGAKTK